MRDQHSRDGAPHVDLPVIRARLSRRTFLRSTAELVMASGVVALVGCHVQEEHAPDELILDQTFAYAFNVPPAPERIDRERLGFLTEDEAETVDAFTARLMPGSPDDPGAREAGVLTFIDVRLSSVDGFWAPTYTEPPFAETYSGNEPPQDARPGTIYVSEDEIDRYGFQSALAPREIYRNGLASVDALARDRFGARFAALPEEDQDEVVRLIADDEADTFDEPSAGLFFDTIRQDTVYGMFADPAYGGNRDMVGWRLIGYPGAQRAYTPEDLQREDPSRPPQSLDELHAFHAGVPANDDLVLPVSDANPRNQQVPARRD